MDYSSNRIKFIESWGNLGVNWGVNKTMAQIHALLLISTKPLCCDTIMEELNISRGNANMNLRALIKWELIHKKCEQGCRKEYFYAEKDIWQAFKMIVKKRKEKELSPVLNLLSELSNTEGQSEEVDEFNKMISEIELLSKKAASALDSLVHSKSNFLVNSMAKFLR